MDTEIKKLPDEKLTDVSGGADRSSPLIPTGVSAKGVPACPYCGCPNFSCDTQGLCTCLACGKQWK